MLKYAKHNTHLLTFLHLFNLITNSLQTTDTPLHVNETELTKKTVPNYSL